MLTDSPPPKGTLRFVLVTFRVEVNIFPNTFYFCVFFPRLEQELMARIITEMYPLKDTDEPEDISHVVSEVSEDSMAEEKERSVFGRCFAQVSWFT